MQLKLLILAVIFFSSVALGRATDTTSFYHFTTENGLPSNTVYSVLKDKNGFIWIVTDNGVVKYDGYKFKVFTTNDGLPTNDVWMLYEDNIGRIWIYSNSYEVGYIQNDQYYPTSVSSKEERIFSMGILSVGDFLLNVYKKGRCFYLTLMTNGNQLVKTWNLTRYFSKYGIIAITQPNLSCFWFIFNKIV